MIIIGDQKFACATCIKGHRVSRCMHTDRPLQEIERKGRPSTQCQYCKDKRNRPGSRVHNQCSCGVPSDATDSPAYKTSNFTVHSDLNATFSPEEHPAVLVSAGQLSPAKESGVETGKREDTSGSNSNFANESQRLYGKTVDWRTPAGIGEEGLRAAQYQVPNLSKPCDCRITGVCICCQTKRRSNIRHRNSTPLSRPASMLDVSHNPIDGKLADVLRKQVSPASSEQGFGSLLPQTITNFPAASNISSNGSNQPALASFHNQEASVYSPHACIRGSASQSGRDTLNSVDQANRSVNSTDSTQSTSRQHHALSDPSAIVAFRAPNPSSLPLHLLDPYVAQSLEYQGISSSLGRTSALTIPSALPMDLPQHHILSAMTINSLPDNEYSLNSNSLPSTAEQLVASSCTFVSFANPDAGSHDGCGHVGYPNATEMNALCNFNVGAALFPQVRHNPALSAPGTCGPMLSQELADPCELIATQTPFHSLQVYSQPPMQMLNRLDSFEPTSLNTPSALGEHANPSPWLYPATSTPVIPTVDLQTHAHATCHKDQNSINLSKSIDAGIERTLQGLQDQPSLRQSPPSLNLPVALQQQERLVVPTPGETYKRESHYTLLDTPFETLQPASHIQREEEHYSLCDELLYFNRWLFPPTQTLSNSNGHRETPSQSATQLSQRNPQSSHAGHSSSLRIVSSSDFNPYEAYDSGAGILGGDPFEQPFHSGSIEAILGSASPDQHYVNNLD